MTIRVFLTSDKAIRHPRYTPQYFAERRIRDAAVIHQLTDDEFEVILYADSKYWRFGPVNIAFYFKAKESLTSFRDCITELTDKSTTNFLLEITPNGPISFVSLAENLMTYRQLLDEMSAELAQTFLIAIHDLMALRRYNPGVPEIAKKSLNRRLIRAIDFSPEQVKAYLNGSEILSGQERAFILSKKPRFHLPFETRNGRRVDVTFSFGSVEDLGKRAAVLIGKNGIGKTHALRQIATNLLQRKTDWDFVDDERGYYASRVLGFYSGPRQSKAFPIQSSKRRRGGYNIFNLQEDNKWSGVTIFDAIADLLTSNQHIASTSRFELFRQSIEQARKGRPTSVYHEKWGAIDLMHVGVAGGRIQFTAGLDRVVAEDVFDFLLELDGRKGVFANDPGDFSSGEESYVRFSAYASLHIENGSAVLMDEPEVYLHPQFIDALMGTLHKLLELTGSVAFIATHSAYVVRCAEEHMVFLMRQPTDQLSFNYEVEFAQPRMKTFGADVGMISLFVFGEDEMETTIDRARMFIERQGGALNSEDVLRILGNLTSLDLVSKIANKTHD